jgi:hypothetical protein
MAGLLPLATADKAAEIKADFFPDAKQASSFARPATEEPLG